jgi:hypothetical protein
MHKNTKEDKTTLTTSVVHTSTKEKNKKKERKTP